MKKNSLLLLLLILISCSQSIKYEADEIIYFDSSKSKGSYSKQYDFKNLLDSAIKIVPLETNAECLIGRMDELEIKNGFIYVKDQMSKSVFRFDMQGKFQGKLEAIGQGPGEYIDPSYMAVLDSSLLLIDSYSEKQIEYRLPSFTFIKEERISTKIWTNQVFSIGGYIYYVNNWSNTNSGNYRFFVRKPNEDAFSRHLPFSSEPVALSISGPEYAINRDSALVIYKGDDVLYRVKGDDIFPRYKVVYKDDKVVYRDGNVTSVFEDNPAGRVLGVNTVNESDRYIFLDISTTGSSGYSLIYDKYDKTTTVYHYGFQIGYFDTDDDVFQFQVQRVIDNQIICWFDANLLVGYKDHKFSKSVNNKEYITLIKDVIANLKEDDNPVLFLFSLKN